MPPAGPRAEMIRVNKVYGGAISAHVLFDIDLAIGSGELVVIVGTSGSGKTTLLNLLGLLDTPTSGEIRLGGRDVAGLSDAQRTRIRRDDLGFIFQFHHLLPAFTVLENALMPCRLRGLAFERSRRDPVARLLDRVGLGDRLHHRPAQLSGGQQQRVAIVRALANDPILVLADEPTGNLDSANSQIIFEIIRELNREGGTAFAVVTHDESLADGADRVIRMADGRIMPETGSTRSQTKGRTQP